MQQQRVVVLGGGSFGTAIANIIADNNHFTSLWMRDEELAAEIQAIGENKRYLPGVILNDKVGATSDLSSCVPHADWVFVAVPSHSLRDVIKTALPLMATHTRIVSMTKGIERNSFKLMSQVIEEEATGHKIGVLSGPNFAKEIAAKELSGSVIASVHADLNLDAQEMLHSGSLRVYASSDILGVELAGALKNIYAIISGMAAALEVGHNTQGLLITRSLAEMSRFAVKLNAKPATFMGLAGIGDLMITCLSPLSRNYRVGYALGKGEELQHVLSQLGQVAEGVNTVAQVKKKAQELDVYMPLLTGLYNIIYCQSSIDEVINTLMSGEQSVDVEFQM